jgi:hypothetical protein
VLYTGMKGIPQGARTARCQRVGRRGGREEFHRLGEMRISVPECLQKGRRCSLLIMKLVNTRSFESVYL